MATKQEIIVVREKISGLETDLKKVLPKSVPSAKFIRTVQTAVALNPDIAGASINSVLSACVKAAADGLLLDGREAALVTYSTKKGVVAQYLPMVNGIYKKVRQSGEISTFGAFVVYEADQFSISYGTDPSLKHDPCVVGPRGGIIGCYSIAKFKKGDVDFEWMSVSEIDAIRSRSRSPTKGPWASDFSEMARKTLIHRHAKRLPMSADAQTVISRIEDMYDLSDTAAPPIKKRGQGAASLNKDLEGPETIDMDPETGEIRDEAPPSEGGAYDGDTRVEGVI